jgi:hypothetical protein
MRTIFFKDASSLQDVIARIVDRRTADPSAALEQVMQLNRHVDLKKGVNAGDVLILPDHPGIKKTGKDVDHLGARTLQEFAAAASLGFEAAAARVRKAADDAVSEQRVLTESLRSKIAKRQIDSDPALREQLDTAAASSAERQKAIKDAASQVDVLSKSFADELAAMRKLMD